MKLWIGNGTKQVCHFQYRPRIAEYSIATVDGSMRPTHGDIRRYVIPNGGQIRLDDLEQKEIDEILKQHSHIVPFKNLNKEKLFQGLCYKVDGDAIPMVFLEERTEQNDDARTKLAKERQVDTAKIITTNLRNVAMDDSAPLKDLHEVSVQVAQASNAEVNGGTPKLNDVVEVVEPGKEPTRRGRQSAGN